MLVAFNAEGIGPLVAKCFPKNRKPIRVVLFQGPRNLNSYWDGGSKDEYRLVNLKTGEVWMMPSSHPAFDRRPDGQRMGNIEISELPENVALLSGGTFMGKPATVTVHLRQENMTPLLPAPKVELSENERRALDVIRAIKGGYRQDEFSRRGLGRYGADNEIVKGLAARGLVKVNKAGAIAATLEGENARV